MDREGAAFSARAWELEVSRGDGEECDDENRLSMEERDMG